METKICSKCGRELPLDNFHWRNKAKGTRRADCKECHSNHMKNKYQENKDKINEVKSTFSCAKCGYNKCVSALDFHHIDPEEKEDTVARLSVHSNIEKVFEEMKKCIILCANCHREFHYLEQKDGITLEDFLK